MFEELLAYHCAPAFAGIKPANIVSCQKSQCPDLSLSVKKLNDALNKKDICIEILCECDKRALVMVYRASLLLKTLNMPQNNNFLLKYGYKKSHSVNDYINTLKSKLVYDKFPHEIGVFLGYPLYDIYCFINHRDKGCLMVGEWRVYHNKKSAEKLFKRFKACRNALLSHVINGDKTLAQIFCPV